MRGRWAGSSKPTRRPMSAAAGLARVVLDVRKRTLQPVVAGNVEHGSIVHTDELRSYGGGLNKAGYAHKTVNHGTGEYVDGNGHVNSLEGFWVRLKLSILRTHVHVSRQHLQKYVKEFEYRYNLRKTPHLMFGALLARLAQTPADHRSERSEHSIKALPVAVTQMLFSETIQFPGFPRFPKA